MCEESNACFNHADTSKMEKAGKALFSSSIRMLDPGSQTSASFHTTFSFQISSLHSINNSDSRGSSGGLTFAILPDEFSIGRAGAWLGFLSHNCDRNSKAFAIEFDTFRDTEFKDPNDNHVGINLGSTVSNVTFDVGLSLNSGGLSLKSGTCMRAWIDYDGARRWIEVRVARDKDLMPMEPLCASMLDISPFLNEYMFVGFTASTGHVAQIHNILSWNFSSVSNAHLLLPGELVCKTKIKSSDRWDTVNILLITFGILLLFLMVFMYALSSHKSHHKQVKSKVELVILDKTKERPRPPNEPKKFTLSEISIATRVFSENEILGHSKKGRFYRGFLQNGTSLAFKYFSKEFSQESILGKDKITKEMDALSRLKHPNLVSMKGWCHEMEELVLVYEYTLNGSLDKWLFGSGVLPWIRRFNIIKEVAEGIKFLHVGKDKSVIHKNIKTSNIFLDINFRAKLGDYGLGNLMKKNQQNKYQGIVSSRPDEKSDVCSFGITILEMISGKRFDDPDLSNEDMDILEWAWGLHERKGLNNLADERLKGRYNVNQVQSLATIALWCTMVNPKVRPTIVEIVQYIHGNLSIPSLPDRKPVSLDSFSSTTKPCLPILSYKANK